MLAEYLEEGAYRFSMAFGRGRFEDFYRATEGNARILEERRKWLREDEAKYLAALPEAGEMVEEVVELAQGHGMLEDVRRDFKTRERIGNDAVSSRPNALARWLGENLEPDYLLLKKEGGAARLVCGCVCFPSSWSLEEKIGQPIEEIHGVVPGLNAAVGKQIGTFLERIKPGVSWTRSNWGLSRSAEWNQHPTRQTPRLDETVTLEEVFFRVEEQSLAALPKTNGILFGIRLKVFPLAGYEGTPEGLKLAHALETMPEEVAQYKGMAAARGRVVNLLRR